MPTLPTVMNVHKAGLRAPGRQTGGLATPPNSSQPAPPTEIMRLTPRTRPSRQWQDLRVFRDFHPPQAPPMRSPQRERRRAAGPTRGTRDGGIRKRGTRISAGVKRASRSGMGASGGRKRASGGGKKSPAQGRLQLVQSTTPRASESRRRSMIDQAWDAFRSSESPSPPSQPSKPSQPSPPSPVSYGLTEDERDPEFMRGLVKAVDNAERDLRRSSGVTSSAPTATALSSSSPIASASNSALPAASAQSSSPPAPPAPSSSQPAPSSSSSLPPPPAQGAAAAAAPPASPEGYWVLVPHGFSVALVPSSGALVVQTAAKPVPSVAPVVPPAPTSSPAPSRLQAVTAIPAVAPAPTPSSSQNRRVPSRRSGSRGRSVGGTHSGTSPSSGTLSGTSRKRKNTSSEAPPRRRSGVAPGPRTNPGTAAGTTSGTPSTVSPPKVSRAPAPPSLRDVSSARARPPSPIPSFSPEHHTTEDTDDEHADDEDSNLGGSSDEDSDDDKASEAVEPVVIVKDVDINVDDEVEGQGPGREGQKEDDSESEDDEDESESEETESDSDLEDKNAPEKKSSSSSSSEESSSEESSSEESSSEESSSDESSSDESTVPTPKRSVDDIRVTRAVKIPPDVLPTVLYRVGRFLASRDLLSLVLLCRSAANAVFPLLAKRTDVARTAGKPLLHWAAERGYDSGHHSLLPLVQRLCAAKANLDHVHNGNTPLTTAIKHGRKVIVEELLKAGAKQVVPGVPHALHLAIKYGARGDTSVVDLLLKSKWPPDVNYIDTAPDHRHSPLFEAALRTSCAARLAKCLLGCGADPNLPNKDGMTPLHAAAKCNSAKMVKQLLDRGRANPNVRSSFNRETPLHLAVSRGEPRVIKALANWSRTKLYIPDRYGNWPIHRLFAHGPPLWDDSELRALLNRCGRKVDRWHMTAKRSRRAT